MRNTVELLGHYGSDEVIACSAWTSTSRELDEKKRKRIPKLINMLWSEGHETPFEKGTVHFLVDCDIASHIHLLKHRLASINAESARYKELKEDKMFIPEDWPEAWQNELMIYTAHGNKLYHECVESLESRLGRKRAKESARFFKTYNSRIQADVQFNMRSFANFIKLRKSEHAQKEIREIAEKMLDLVKGIEENPFQHTLNSWGY
jgi:thymidylate synthase (FAD)|tara:strand:- start:4008 stop:4625 length:618 start_codon:yes stop_codon:yes gene_type:complete